MAFSTRRQEMLPLDALEEFCRSTDAVVECKMKLVMKLKDVHKSHGSVPDYCETAYNWFQAKYGMLCPMQCEKLQCKSTCLWLEEKTKLTKRAEDLSRDGVEASAAKDDMKAAATELKRAEGKVKDMNRAVNVSVQLMVRAQERLIEQQGWTQKAQTKVSKLKAKIVSLEDARANFTQQIRANRTKLQKLQFSVSEAKLEDSILRKRADRLEKKINQTVEKAKNLPQQLAARRAALDERFLATQNFSGAALMIRDLVKAQEARFANYTKSFLKAETVWLNAKAVGTMPQKAIDAYESLMVQRKAQMKAEELILNKTKHHQSMLLAELNRSNQDLIVLGAEVDTLVMKSEAAVSEVGAYTAQLGQVEIDAKNLTTQNLTQVAIDIWGVRNNMHKAAQEYVKVKKTLDATMKYETEESRKLRVELDRERKLNQGVADAQARQTQTQDDLKKAAKALQEATVKELYARDKFRMLSTALDDNLKANKDAMRQLQHMAPKIVRQHGLGLMEVFAAW